MADTSQVEVPPHTNGISDEMDDEERAKMRPADIDADVKEMERRKRVELIMNSKLFRDELERIIEVQLRDGSGTSGLMQQISDMMGVSKNAGNVFKNSNCVVPINDIRGIEAMGYAKGEKILRCKLAAVYRLIDLYGWTQGTSTLITARLNQDEEHFLVNPYGMLFHEITASSLIKADMQGNVVEQGTTNFGVNLSAYSLHAAIHSSRPDIKCIIHVHTPSVVAISALKCGLLPISQESVVIGEVSTHPYIGGISDPEEKDKITRNLGPNNKVLLLTNQGAVCCGETIEEAFFNARNTVLASESQLKLMPMGIDNLILLNDETRKKLYEAAHKAPESSPRPDQPSILETKIERKWRVGGVEFEALMRMLDNAGFRTGYIYRHPLVKGDPPRPRSDVEVPPAVSSLGYLLEEEELYKQGLWKKLEGGRKGNDRTRWLNSPNVYQKVEILETGTPDPKKITKWVADGSPTHSSTPVKIENALQFVPKNTNPKEFKKLQQQIKDYRRADKISAGPQSHILEGVTWEEARKMQDAGVTQTGDQVVLMGAASKGIIQRGFQHNATMYKSPYAKNPFDSITDEEIDEYKKVVEKKTKGEYDTDFSESEGLSSAQINKRISDIRSPTSAASETEEESRDEPQVLRIETKQAPKPSQPEVVLSDVLHPREVILDDEVFLEAPADTNTPPDVASRNFLMAERKSATNSMRRRNVVRLVAQVHGAKSPSYRTNSFAGFPRGSYAVPNPMHYHIARCTRATQHLRPTLIKLTDPSHITTSTCDNVTINVGNRSFCVDVSIEVLRAFIYPFANSLNLIAGDVNVNSAASQTCYNLVETEITPVDLSCTVTPFMSKAQGEDEMNSFERRIMQKLHDNLVDDLVVSNQEFEIDVNSTSNNVSTTVASFEYCEGELPEIYNFSEESTSSLKEFTNNKEEHKLFINDNLSKNLIGGKVLNISDEKRDTIQEQKKMQEENIFKVSSISKFSPVLQQKKTEEQPQIILKGVEYDQQDDNKAPKKDEGNVLNMEDKENIEYDEQLQKVVNAKQMENVRFQAEKDITIKEIATQTEYVTVQKTSTSDESKTLYKSQGVSTVEVYDEDKRRKKQSIGLCKSQELSVIQTYDENENNLKNSDEFKEFIEKSDNRDISILAAIDFNAFKRRNSEENIMSDKKYASEEHTVKNLSSNPPVIDVLSSAEDKKFEDNSPSKSFKEQNEINEKECTNQTKFFKPISLQSAKIGLNTGTCAISDEVSLKFGNDQQERVEEKIEENQLKESKEEINNLCKNEACLKKDKDNEDIPIVTLGDEQEEKYFAVEKVFNEEQQEQKELDSSAMENSLQKVEKNNTSITILGKVPTKLEKDQVKIMQQETPITISSEVSIKFGNIQDKITQHDKVVKEQESETISEVGCNLKVFEDNIKLIIVESVKNINNNCQEKSKSKTSDNSDEFKIVEGTTGLNTNTNQKHGDQDNTNSNLKAGSISEISNKSLQHIKGKNKRRKSKGKKGNINDTDSKINEKRPIDDSCKPNLDITEKIDSCVTESSEHKCSETEECIHQPKTSRKEYEMTKKSVDENKMLDSQIDEHRRECNKMIETVENCKYNKNRASEINKKTFETEETIKFIADESSIEIFNIFIDTTDASNKTSMSEITIDNSDETIENLIINPGGNTYGTFNDSTISFSSAAIASLENDNTLQNVSEFNETIPKELCEFRYCHDINSMKPVPSDNSEKTQGNHITEKIEIKQKHNSDVNVATECIHLSSEIRNEEKPHIIDNVDEILLLLDNNLFTTQDQHGNVKKMIGFDEGNTSSLLTIQNQKSNEDKDDLNERSKVIEKVLENQLSKTTDCNDNLIIKEESYSLKQSYFEGDTLPKQNLQVTAEGNSEVSTEEKEEKNTITRNTLFDQNPEVSAHVNLQQEEITENHSELNPAKQDLSISKRNIDVDIEQEMVNLITKYITKNCLELSDAVIFPEVERDENFADLIRLLVHLYSEYFFNSCTDDNMKTELRLSLQNKVLIALNVNQSGDEVSDRSFVVTEFLCELLDGVFNFLECSKDRFDEFEDELRGNNVHSTPENNRMQPLSNQKNGAYDSKRDGGRMLFNTKDFFKVDDAIQKEDFEGNNVFEGNEGNTIADFKGIKRPNNEMKNDQSSNSICKDQKVYISDDSGFVVTKTLECGLSEDSSSKLKEESRKPTITHEDERLKIAISCKGKDFQTPNIQNNNNVKISEIKKCSLKAEECLKQGGVLEFALNKRKEFSRSEIRGEFKFVDDNFKPEHVNKIRKKFEELKESKSTLTQCDDISGRIKAPGRHDVNTLAKRYEELEEKKSQPLDVKKKFQEDKYPHSFTNIKTSCDGGALLSVEEFEEDLTSFQMKRMRSGSEFYWLSITKSPKQLTPIKKPIVINVDDIPLRPPPDLNVTLELGDEDSECLSPILEEANRRLFFDDDESPCLEETDNRDVNRVVHNEVHFSRSNTHTSTSYTQSENVRFKKNTDANDNEGNWMGYKTAKF